MTKKDINGYDLYNLKREYDVACRSDPILEAERKREEKRRYSSETGSYGYVSNASLVLIGALVLFVLIVDVISSFI